MKCRQKFLRYLVGCALVIAFLSGCKPQKYPDGLYAELTTNKGPIVLRLEFEKTPMTVANFVGLAEGAIKNAALPEGAPYFDGTKWHRVVAGHVIQCGMPKDGKEQGPGYQFPNEISPDLNHGRAGMVGMANAGSHTNGSQWYITLADRSYLDGNYTVFGSVIEGLDIVSAIVQGDIVQRVKIVRFGRAARGFRPTTSSFLKMVEEANVRVKEAAEKKKAAEEEMVAGKWPNAVAAENGLKFIIFKEGQGPLPAPGAKLNVAYSGKDLYGLTFISTAADGTPYRGDAPEPFVFEAGKTRINPGFDAVVVRMKKGEKRLIIVPAELGYRSNVFSAKQRPNEKRFIIPPETRLIYEVELLDILK